MDIFGDIEEARPGELHAARVMSNIDDFIASVNSMPSKKLKKERKTQEDTTHKGKHQDPSRNGTVSSWTWVRSVNDTQNTDFIQEFLHRPAVEILPESHQSSVQSPTETLSDDSMPMAIDSEVMSDYELPKTRSTQRTVSAEPMVEDTSGVLISSDFWYWLFNAPLPKSRL